MMVRETQYTVTVVPQGGGRHRPRAQAGFSLLVALVLLFALALLGLSVANTIALDVEVAGAERAADQALYIAEQGIARGLEIVAASPDVVSGQPLTNYLTGLNAGGALISAGDPDLQLVGWFEISPGVTITDPDGTNIGQVRLAVKDDNDDGSATTDTNQKILVRALSRTSGGARRLIEVEVGPK